GSIPMLVIGTIFHPKSRSNFMEWLFNFDVSWVRSRCLSSGPYSTQKAAPISWSGFLIFKNKEMFSQ
ncbi:MAG: hypothetical protein ACK49O_02080, partial [Bacteroidota bacterium]